MRTGQARKRDANEKPIVDALRAIGVFVLRVSGDGAPDLLTFHWREGWVPIEVKMPKKGLTEAQQHTRALAPFVVVESVAEALAVFGAGR